MTENDCEALSGWFTGLHVETPDETALDSAVEKTSGSTTATAIPLSELDEDELAADTGGFIPSKDKTLRRIDSQQEGVDSVSVLKSRLAQTQEDLGKAKKWLDGFSNQIEELQNQIKSYEVAELTTRQERIKRGKTLKAELKQCQDRIKQLEERDGLEEMKLDGRGSAVPDIIHFEKCPESDMSMKVVLARTFSFSKRQWQEDGGLKEAHDNAAVGCLRMGGRLYVAKAGKTREDFGDFINSDHWTTEAMQLAKLVGSSRLRCFATHAEPQLMAFYITRTLRESGHKLVDFSNISTFPVKESCTELDKVIINVSQGICGSCRNLADSVNKYAKNHGFCFEPTHTPMGT